MCSIDYNDPRKEINIILATALINVSGKNKIKMEPRAFLDSCSQSNFKTRSLCRKLKLKQSPINIQVGVLGQLGPGVDGQCEVAIEPRQGGHRFKIRCLIVNQITEDLMPGSSFNLESLEIPSHLKLADPRFNVPERIDLLIGAKWFWDLLCVGRRKLANNLVMQKTKLGWVVGCPMTAPAPQRKSYKYRETANKILGN